MPRTDNNVATKDIENEFGLFNGKSQPDLQTAWDFYQRLKEYNEKLGTDYRVQVCENYYNSMQWNDIDSGNMPKPTINITKKLVNTFVGIMVGDKITLQAKPRSISYDKQKSKFYTTITNKVLDYILDINDFVSLTKEFVKDAGVDGDGCMHFYWDADYRTGDYVGPNDNQSEIRGTVRIERIYNTNVFFGNPMNPNKEEQEYIIIAKRVPVRLAKMEAKNNGCEDWETIGEDDEKMDHVDPPKYINGDCTVCLMYWRDAESGEIWSCKYTSSAFVQKPVNTKFHHFPILWMSWDEIKYCYHGQSMTAGIIDNNTMINREIAMTGISVDRNSYPTVIYDQNRMPDGVDNSVGAEIGVQGGDLDNVYKVVDGTNVASTAFQFIEMMYDKSLESMGASKVLTGDTKAYNTSAIVATSRNSLTIHEPTKISFHSVIKEAGDIIMDIYTQCADERYVLVPLEFAAPNMREAFEYSGLQVPDEVPIKFDFSTLKDFPMNITFNASEGSFITQNSQQEKLDMLLQGGFISFKQYLERCPGDIIPDVESLRKEVEEQEQIARQQMGMSPNEAVTPNGVGMIENPDMRNQEVPSGKGNGSMQREIAKTGDTKKVI